MAERAERSGVPTPAELSDDFFAAAKALRAHANATLREQGFTLARGKLLSILQRNGATRVSVLARKLDITTRSVTEAVDALERDGLVRRAPDPADRRAVLVSLTDRGSAVIDAAVQPRRAAMKRTFGALSPSQRTQLAELLAILTASTRDPG
ncbi:MarR family winged helix-turn-helix transcriptional regulator [Mycolicibacterium monacense]|uniref:MarR family winged helix-turn-helix transcriptional regulator n=1 Tax=Mycolicibacterium monacense TaxID=85693 RepID=UPI0007EA7DB0|nr:MarR family transcriptional regulator [Mycolicibacterium monacense]OBB58869.1 MarR family transcriptional regulator [Mycolicibacterium monacense]OBF56554.1 MarR family transcriptional regulator [Mycolicibacterium monacense]